MTQPQHQQAAVSGNTGLRWCLLICTEQAEQPQLTGLPRLHCVRHEPSETLANGYTASRFEADGQT